jgi:hypothetical protein
MAVHPSGQFIECVISVTTPKWKKTQQDFQRDDKGIRESARSERNSRKECMSSLGQNANFLLRAFGEKSKDPAYKLC